jgi:ABC-type antimicrobial peptide transport system permease subunit
MFKNYFKIALRNLAKNKVHSFINITGLSVGMAIAMMIGCWIWDELSFDHYNRNYDHIARVMQNQKNNGEIFTYGGEPFPLANELRSKYGSDFENVVMGYGPRDLTLTIGEKMFTQSTAYFEPTAPRLLDLTMIHGSEDGLKEPNTILLSESVAKAYFGNTDPVNQPVRIGGDHIVKVTGVYKDLPANSFLSGLGVIATWQILYDAWGLKTREHPWRMNAFQVYVRLKDNASLTAVNSKIKDAKREYQQAGDAMNGSQLFLQPMKQWHLYSEFKNGVNAGGRIKYVRLYGVIGFFVLLLACINFMNLSTARSERRAREVGIRKAIGSLRSQLIFQFFSESLVIVAFAFIASLVLVQLMLPFFNSIADKKMTIPLSSPLFWLLGLGFSLITGLVAGSYPALYLSSFHPVKVLKGTLRVGALAVLPRKVLITLQFTVSIVLIIGTIVVFRQIHYAQDRPIGYDRNGLVNVRVNSDAIHDHFEAIKTELLSTGTITAMTESESGTTGFGAGSSGFEWKGKDPGLATDFPTTAVSYDYGKTVHWQLTQGRDFSRDFATDSMAFIVNEAAVRYMGLKTPIGETVKWFGRNYKIVGVVKDMIVESPYEPVRPFFFYMYNYSHGSVILKIAPTIGAHEALTRIETLFKKFNPAQPFNYRFADAEYAKKFGDEQRIGKLAAFFAVLAIFICCLGLFGMASFIAEQRTKEIGVRKVLGASTFSLWRLLSKEFVILVTISLLIATPVAFYFMHNWLQNYQYRTSIDWWIFASAGVCLIVITLLTVSFQAIKAALANPVESLRSE